MTKKILITGANGVLAKKIIFGLLVKDDVEIFGLTRALKPDKQIQNVTYVSNEDFFTGKFDITQIDTVVNCAFSRNQKFPDIADSIRYTKELFLKLSEANTKEVINISSQSVYGAYREGKSTEDALVAPVDAYALGKFTCEELGEVIFKNSKTKFTNLRLASLIGKEYEERVINKMVKFAGTSHSLEVTNGKQQFGYLHVDDAANAVIALIFANLENWDLVYNIGSNKSGEINLLEMAELIKKKYQEYGNSVHITHKTSDRKTLVNSNKFQSQTNWTPNIVLEEFIEELIETKPLI